MENTKLKPSNSNGSSKNSYNETLQENPNKRAQPSLLMILFEIELKDIYWAEKASAKAFPIMIKSATSERLIDTLASHFEETENHVTRVEAVFESMGKKAVAKKCEVMEELIKEVGEVMESCEAGAMCDAEIISAEQKMKHYEIASYETLRYFAQTLGLSEAVALLAANLEEKKVANERLAEVATRVGSFEEEAMEV